MDYIRVRWIHTLLNEPIWLISELDADRMETRKVYIFRDGSKGYATQGEEVGDTRLGIMPVPPLEEIASDPQFLPEQISEAEFEVIWAERSR